MLADQLFGLNASAGGTLRVNDNTRVVVTGVLNGEKFNTYDGLSNLSGGLQGELQYRRIRGFRRGDVRGLRARLAGQLRVAPARR